MIFYLLLMLHIIAFFTQILQSMPMLLHPLSWFLFLWQISKKLSWLDGEPGQGHGPLPGAMYYNPDPGLSWPWPESSWWKIKMCSFWQRNLFLYLNQIHIYEYSPQKVIRVLAPLYTLKLYPKFTSCFCDQMEISNTF